MTAVFTLAVAIIVMLYPATPEWLFADAFLAAIVATGRLCWPPRDHGDPA